MRPVLPAILALACCSKPQPMTAVEGEIKPIGTAALPVGKHRFVMSSTHELSCSQSFEVHSNHVDYELEIEPGGRATLKVSGSKRTTFGPAAAKFSLGKSEVNETTKPIAERWVGTARMDSKGLRLELASEKKSWFLGCEVKKIEASLPYVAGADAKAKRMVDVFSCTPTRHVAENDEKAFTALTFAPSPGIAQRLEDFGFGGGRVEVRLLGD